MTHARDRQPACGFCDGTGLWRDRDDDPAAPDPCPLCEGSGAGPSQRGGASLPAAASSALPIERISVALSGLTPAERQRLYEELHGRYDCRIYRR